MAGHHLWYGIPGYLLKKLQQRKKRLRLHSFGPLWTISTGNLLSWPFELFHWFFLHYFTLYVVDIHQIMLISLFTTPFDHFYFHPTLRLKSFEIGTLSLPSNLELIFQNQNENWNVTTFIGANVIGMCCKRIKTDLFCNSALPACTM